MQPRDFFNHINLALHIQPPARNVYEKLAAIQSRGNGIEPKLLQDAKNVSFFQIAAQYPPHF